MDTCFVEQNCVMSLFHSKTCQTVSYQYMMLTFSKISRNLSVSALLMNWIPWRKRKQWFPWKDHLSHEIDHVYLKYQKLNKYCIYSYNKYPGAYKRKSVNIYIYIYICSRNQGELHSRQHNSSHWISSFIHHLLLDIHRHITRNIIYDHSRPNFETHWARDTVSHTLYGATLHAACDVATHHIDGVARAPKCYDLAMADVHVHTYLVWPTCT